MTKSITLATFLSATALSTLTAPAMAQSSEGVSANEAIVVTARRVEESLQDVPLSITALSSETLEEMSVDEISDINELASNVNITQGIGSLGLIAAYIRGIGTAENDLSVDPAVGVYIDGVYAGRNNSANLKLVELERIEILRGPQGSTFGRNTTGGAINMVTRKPYEEFSAEQAVGYGNFNRWYSATRVDTGVIGNSGLSATITYEHSESDGYVKNTDSDSRYEPGGYNSEAVWAKVHGEWGDLTADYTFDYNDLRGYPPAFIVEFANENVTGFVGPRSASLGGQFLDVSPGYRSRYALVDIDRQEVETMGHALTLEYEVSDAISIKSISAIRSFKSYLQNGYGPGNLQGVVLGGDPPVQQVSLLTAEKSGEQDQFSQELQAYGTLGDLSYIVGLYYYEEDGFDANTSFYNFVLNHPAAGLSAFQGSSPKFYSFDNNSKAVYGELAYRPSWLEGLEIAVGGRYTRDRRSVDQEMPQVRADSTTFNKTTYNVTVSYDWTPEIMTYLRHGTGYRSGRFNTRADGDIDVPFIVRPEIATVYEAGFKTELLDRKLRVNGAVFRTDYDNLQSNQFTGDVGFALNANARFQGFEVEVLAQPVPGFTIDASVGHVDPKHKGIFLLNPETGEFEDFSATSKFGYVANWTMHLGGRYEHDLGDSGNLILRLDYSRKSKRYFTTSAVVNPFHEQIAQPGYGLLNGRMSISEIPLGAVEGEVSLWMRNITNEKYRVAGIDFGSFGFGGGIYGEPRMYGLDVKVGF